MNHYRHTGYTDRWGYPIPHGVRGVRFGADAAATLTPVILANADGSDVAIGSGLLPPGAFTKPSTSVPTAPPGLPEEFDFCIQENGMILRARDIGHKLHGITVQGTCFYDEGAGMRMCSFDMAGDTSATVPACVDMATFVPEGGPPESSYVPEPPPQGCCFDAETSTLVAPAGSSCRYHGLVVTVVAETEVGGVKFASVEHPDLPGGGIRVPVCRPLGREARFVPRPPADRVPENCCIDEETLAIVCPDPSHPSHGKSVKDMLVECFDGPEGRTCRIKVGDHLVDLPVCHAPPSIPIPPAELIPRIPVLCCYDPQTSSLVCEGTPYHGLRVELVAEAELPDGTPIASVEHPSLPGGGIRAPICLGHPPGVRPPEDAPKVPKGCCYRYATGTLDCEGNRLHGHKVVLIEQGAIGPDDVLRVKVHHPKLGEMTLPVCDIQVTGCGSGCREGWENPPCGELGCGTDPRHYCGESNDEAYEGRSHAGGYQNVQDRGYNIGYRGPSDMPGMRGAGQEGGFRQYGSGHGESDRKDIEKMTRRHGRYGKKPGRARTTTIQTAAEISGANSVIQYKTWPGICWSVKNGRVEQEGTPHWADADLIHHDGGPWAIVRIHGWEGFYKVSVCGGPRQYGSGHGIQSADSRGYGVGYRGESDRPGMRGAGQDGGPRQYGGWSGRPSEVARGHGTWKYDGPGASLRDGWRPHMDSLQQGGVTMLPWGRLGLTSPPSISGDSAGYNTQLWKGRDDVHRALLTLGYPGPDVGRFQSDWNTIVQTVSTHPSLQELDFSRVMHGNLIVDETAGIDTMNALEVALVNQNDGLAWSSLLHMADSSGFGATHHPRRYAGQSYAGCTAHWDCGPGKGCFNGICSSWDKGGDSFFDMTAMAKPKRRSLRGRRHAGPPPLPPPPPPPPPGPGGGIPPVGEPKPIQIPPTGGTGGGSFVPGVLYKTPKPRNLRGRRHAGGTSGPEPHYPYPCGSCPDGSEAYCIMWTDGTSSGGGCSSTAAVPKVKARPRRRRSRMSWSR